MARIAFIQNFWYQYLGIMYISSVLKNANHSCEVFIEGGEKNLLDSVKKFNPDILGFYSTTGNQKWVIETANKLKKELNCKVILGGPHPTFFTETIEDKRIDAICIGEGEYAMQEFCSRFDRGETLRDIQNMWVKEDGNIYKNPWKCLKNFNFRNAPNSKNYLGQELAFDVDPENINCPKCGNKFFPKFC